MDKHNFDCPKFDNGCTHYPLSDGSPSICWWLEGNQCKVYNKLVGGME